MSHAMRKATTGTPTEASSALPDLSTTEKAAILRRYNGVMRCALTVTPDRHGPIQHANCIRRNSQGPPLRELEWKLGRECDEWDVNATDNVFYLEIAVHFNFEKHEPEGRWALVPNDPLFERVTTALQNALATVPSSGADYMWPDYTTTLPPDRTPYRYRFVNSTGCGYFTNFRILEDAGRPTLCWYEDWEKFPLFLDAYLHPYIVICKALSQFEVHKSLIANSPTRMAVYEKLTNIQRIRNRHPVPLHVKNIDDKDTHTPAPTEFSDTASSNGERRLLRNRNASANTKPRGIADIAQPSGTGDIKGGQSDGKQHGRAIPPVPASRMNCRGPILPCPTAAKPKTGRASGRGSHVGCPVNRTRPRLLHVEEWVMDIARQPYLHRPTHDPIFHRLGEKQEPRGPLYLPWVPDWEWEKCLLHNETFTSNDWAVREALCNLTAPLVPRDTKLGD